MRRLARHLLTLLPIVALLAGCIYIPARDSPAREGAPDPNRLIGPPDSGKPIRPGAATVERVVRLLGTPWATGESLVFVYSFEMKAGYWVVIPLGIGRASRVIAVRLEFTPDGILRDFEIERGGHSAMNFLGPTPPEPRMLEDARQRMMREEVRKRRMRPATAPAVGDAG